MFADAALGAVNVRMIEVAHSACHTESSSSYQHLSRIG